MIKRIYQNIAELLSNEEVLIIYGPRQAGRTTILESYLKTLKIPYKLDSGDDVDVQMTLSSGKFSVIFRMLQGMRLSQLMRHKK